MQMNIEEFEQLSTDTQADIMKIFLLRVSGTKEKAQEYHKHMMECPTCMDIFTYRLLDFIERTKAES